MSSLVAITREITSAIVDCELTHGSRVPIDVEKARAQHLEYERALSDLGCSVVRLAADKSLADSVFIEDIAVVLDGVAIVMLPGAQSRRPEIAAVSETLERYRPIERIELPGTMDGGDVLVIGRRIFVGLSSRTNAAGIAQLQKLAVPHGYSVQAIAVKGCLHLKSAVTALSDDLLLINRAWTPADSFDEYETIDVDPDEPYAANAVRVGNAVLYPMAFPRTEERMRRRGLTIRTLDVSELAKAEGAVTCCSLIFEVNS